MDKFYKNNKHLFAFEYEWELTDEQIDEFYKCRDDFWYFFSKYCYITSLDDGYVTFKPYDYQRRVINACMENRFVIAKLPRQFGKTVCIKCVLLWHFIFSNRINILIVANKEKSAKRILSEIKEMYVKLPHFLKYGVKKWDAGEIEVGTNASSNPSENFINKITTAACTDDAGRGESVDIVYADEFAYVDNDEDFYESIYPTLSSGKNTKFIITSTPNGFNMFADIWFKSVQGDNLFVPIEVHWSEHPKRDEQWKLETINNLGEKRFNKEFECMFAGSGNNIFNTEDTIKIQAMIQNPINEIGDIRYYEKPEVGYEYIAIADTAGGTANDFSVCDIYKVNNGKLEQVAIFRCNTIIPYDFSKVVKDLATAYNNANVLVEVNGIGSSVASTLFSTLDYANIFYTYSKNGDLKIGGTKRGLSMTATINKNGAMEANRRVGNSVIVKDAVTITELTVVEEKSGKYQAPSDKYNDDASDCVLMLCALLESPDIENYIDGVKEDGENYLSYNSISIDEALSVFAFTEEQILS